MRKKQTLTWRNRSRPYLFLLPSITGVGIFVFFPFLDVLRRSVLDAMGADFVGMENYLTVIGKSSFQLAVWNTVRFIAVCIPLLMVLSLAIAVMINGITKLKELLKTVFLFPMAIPVASIVVLWRLVFDNSGFLNAFIDMFHISPVDWMNSPSAFYVLVFSYLWKNTGYDMVLWLAGLYAVPESLYEAARIDGADRKECFIHITLPMLRPTAAMLAVLSLVNSFKVFREAYLIAGDYPHKSIYMLQHLFNNWFVKLDIQKMSAASVLMALTVALIMIGVHRSNEKKT